MQHIILVDNIRCGGCSNSINKKISALDHIESVEIDIEAGQVTVHAPESQRSLICETLLSLGYPEQGSSEGLAALGAKAKSVVSCAVGKVS